MAPQYDPWIGAFGRAPVEYIRGIFQPKVDPNAWRTDPLSGAVGSSPAAVIRALAGAAARPAAAAEMEAGGRPEGSMATLGGKPVQWMDGRWVPFQTEGQMAREQQALMRAQAPAAPILPPPGGVTPIVRGTRDGVTPDRTQSDEYKAQLAQYGALQKAKKFEEADKLGMEIWQQKYGKTPLGQPGGVVGKYNPLMEGMPGHVQTTANIVPGENMPTPGFSTESSFSIGANAVPAPWSTQGMAVSEPYSEAMKKAAEKTNPMNLISQQPLEGDVLNKVSGFLSQFGK